MLTVACVWVRSEVYDDRDWVLRLYSMAQRWIGCSNYPFEFLCITPHVDEFRDAQPVVAVKPTISLPPTAKPWWNKASLWNLERERVLYFDLDVVLLGGLQQLVDYPSDLVVASSNGVPIRNHAFNSSVMCWNPRCYQVQEIIRPALNTKPWNRWIGDQQWLSMLPMKVDLYPSRWIHKYNVGHKIPYQPPVDTIVALTIQGGKNKQLIANGHQWVERAWL